METVTVNIHSFSMPFFLFQLYNFALCCTMVYVGQFVLLLWHGTSNAGDLGHFHLPASFCLNNFGPERFVVARRSSGW